MHYYNCIIVLNHITIAMTPMVIITTYEVTIWLKIVVCNAKLIYRTYFMHS